MLRIENLTKIYSSTAGILATLDNISLQVNKGEFVSIIGPSGSGKSTLFNLISGLEKPDAGLINLEGHSIIGQRGHVSYMLQKDLLLPWRTVLDNCVLGMEIQKLPRQIALQRARSLMVEFELDGYADSFPRVLSGGMRQRVAFLRTILAGRELLLLDEPFGSLDAFTKSEMQQWLAKVWEKYRATVLFITHDVEEALLLSDRIYVFSPRPAKVIMEMKVDIPRPRLQQTSLQPSFIEMKKKIVEMLFPA